MAKVRHRPALFLIASIVVIAAHVALNARYASSSESISYGFFLPLSALAGATVWWNAHRCAPAIRKSWALFASALLLWFAATVMAALVHFYSLGSPTTANLDDFFYFFYGVPVLLVIAAPDANERGTLFFWLDCILAAGVGFLAYIELFAVIPFSGAPRHPMPVSRLIWIYDIENLILAAFATIRMVASPRNNSASRRFYRIIVVFLWTYTFCATIYNHIVSMMYDAGRLDAVVDIPFLALAILAVSSPMVLIAQEEPQAAGPLAVFIDNARPTLLGLGLVLLAAVVARQHFDIAMAAILGAFVLYAVRSAMLQVRIVNTQMLLETANSRLSEMTLEDGLTGIGNRRCFDQRLAQEWGRSHRSRSPLSLLLVDIDHFKKLNDTYGHVLGDQCLMQVARTLRGVLQRSADLLARYGGEEFVALLPETDAAGAQNVAGLFQVALRNTPPVPGLESQITVSIGVTTWTHRKHVSMQRFVNAADRALYQAKQNGRDRIEFLSLDDEFDTATPQT